MIPANCPGAADQAAAHVWFHNHGEELDSRLGACFSRLDPEARAEAVGDCRATIYAWCLSAARRGRLDRITPFTAATYAAAGRRAGRRFTGSSWCDVMGDAARAAGRTQVVSIEDSPIELGLQRTSGTVSLAEALPDPRGWDRPDQNARRNSDYPAILESGAVNAKARRVFSLLAAGQGSVRNKDLAADLGVSEGRATQLKTLLADALSAYGYGCPLGRSRRQRQRPGRGLGRQPGPVRHPTARAGSAA